MQALRYFIQLEVQVQVRYQDERCQVFGSTSSLPTRASVMRQFLKWQVQEIQVQVGYLDRYQVHPFMPKAIFFNDRHRLSMV